MRFDASVTLIGVASQDLFPPGGIAFGKDGAMYVTNNIVSAGGEVLRIDL